MAGSSGGALLTDKKWAPRLQPSTRPCCIMACATFLTLKSNQNKTTNIPRKCAFRNALNGYLGNSTGMLEVSTWRQNSDERGVNPLVPLSSPEMKCEKAFTWSCLFNDLRRNELSKKVTRSCTCIKLKNRMSGWKLRDNWHGIARAWVYSPISQDPHRRRTAHSWRNGTWRRVTQKKITQMR